MKSILLFLFCSFAAVNLFAARIAVAQPAVKGKLPAEDVDMLWSMLEVSIGGDHELVTRDALKQMLTEIGLSSSGLVDPADIAARPGKLKGVDSLLIPTIGRIGSRYVLTLSVIDASTGIVDADARTQVMSEDFDGIIDRLSDAFEELGMGRPVRKRGVMTLLAFQDRANGFMPAYAVDHAVVSLEAAMLENKYRLRTMKSIRNLLKENKLDDPEIADPATFRRMGEILRTDYLLQPVVRRFEIVSSEVYVAATRRNVKINTGYYEGNVKIIEVSSGETAGQIPFSVAVDFSRMSRETIGWGDKDYALFLVDSSIPVIMDAVNRSFADE